MVEVEVEVEGEEEEEDVEPEEYDEEAKGSQVCGRDEFFAVEVAASARCEITVSIIVYEFALQQLQFTALAQLLLITPVSNDNDIGRQTVLAFYPA
ncbi:uncharacterized protein FTOL_08041 [Fusarium torulosum]|uniref:Uncharacterized protein n=1 Tax=Fusarium torulosum TaxID=33205 RepID=A0AAE8MC33_9HYPO|nr:uncharacterized protein FTOL_08041 [Fusarium torulosum]